MRRFASALLLVLLIAPAWAAPSTMVGSWFGHGQPDDKSAMYIDRMRADGSWRGEYRTCVKGKPRDQVQTGRWSLAGDVITLSVQQVDGQPFARTDLYRMLSHDAQNQVYVVMFSNFRYTPRRMADDFKMPGCDLVS
jgi:hypothetical protein